MKLKPPGVIVAVGALLGGLLADNRRAPPQPQRIPPQPSPPAAELSAAVQQQAATACRALVTGDRLRAHRRGGTGLSPDRILRYAWGDAAVRPHDLGYEGVRRWIGCLGFWRLKRAAA